MVKSLFSSFSVFSPYNQSPNSLKIYRDKVAISADSEFVLQFACLDCLSKGFAWSWSCVKGDFPVFVLLWIDLYWKCLEDERSALSVCVYEMATSENCRNAAGAGKGNFSVIKRVYHMQLLSCCVCASNWTSNSTFANENFCNLLYNFEFYVLFMKLMLRKRCTRSYGEHVQVRLWQCHVKASWCSISHKVILNRFASICAFQTEICA